MEVLILRELRTRFVQVLKLRMLASGTCKAVRILLDDEKKALGPAKGAAP
jgi:hypothetical protein